MKNGFISDGFQEDKDVAVLQKILMKKIYIWKRRRKKKEKEKEKRGLTKGSTFQFRSSEHIYEDFNCIQAALSFNP